MENSGQIHAPASLPPGEIATDKHWLGSWVGTRAGLDVVEKRKFLPLPGIELWPYSSKPNYYNDRAIPADIIIIIIIIIATTTTATTTTKIPTSALLLAVSLVLVRLKLRYQTILHLTTQSREEEVFLTDRQTDRHGVSVGFP